jgi:hypothetical protein
MTRDALIAAFALAAEAHADVDALFLGGSLGRGEGDVWSDVDLILVVGPTAHSAFVGALRAWVEAVAPPVLWRQVYPGVPLYMAVTADYLRYDITVVTPDQVIESADRVRVLADRIGLHGHLPASRPQPATSPAALTAVVEEFLRVLGLLPVGVGRREYASAQSGVGLLRQQLQALMVLEARPVSPPGALSMSRALPRRDLEVLERLGDVAASAESIIGQSLACAEAFLPRARRLAAAVGANWPQALETAVRDHLKRELGLELAG